LRFFFGVAYDRGYRCISLAPVTRPRSQCSRPHGVSFLQDTFLRLPRCRARGRRGQPCLSPVAAQRVVDRVILSTLCQRHGALYGLSRLQRQILILAAHGQAERLSLLQSQNLREADRAFILRHASDEFHCRLLIQLFGLTPFAKPKRARNGTLTCDRQERLGPVSLCHDRPHFFRPTGSHRARGKTVDRAKYNVAKASLSRAVARLEARGLLRAAVYGVRLTVMGAAAVALLAPKEAGPSSHSRRRREVGS
jgi:hypothetical protein